ncbi:hypothetical protein [Geobacillus zalihae]|uniref:hypothetical protein n=1 Tax=Geobacillus zalihae TaxID=213419 RepID=UPI000763E8C1|nr:hypothetical protein [Geobacillus zalihae]
MLALTELTGWNVAYLRIGIEAFVLLAGWLLGGPVSFGTFLFCVTIGSIAGLALPQCQKVASRLLGPAAGTRMQGLSR